MNDREKNIRFVERHEIDLIKWDRCIADAANGLVYAQSFYLDAMAENWSALVQGDYAYVMPLTWNKKFGFAYLYQPYFTKALGVFGAFSAASDISDFLQAIPKSFRYWDFDLNEKNTVPENFAYLKARTRTNYFLPLHDPYEKMQSRYKRLAHRMIRKAADLPLHVSRHETPKTIIELYRRNYQDKHPAISGPVYERLLRCMEIAQDQKKVKTYTALSAAGEIRAFYMLLTDDRFLYSLLGGSTAAGKEAGAFYYLTDTILREHAGTGKIFRFEGSDIAGVSFFDSLFGPDRTEYMHITRNRLPFPFNLFK